MVRSINNQKKTHIKNNLKCDNKLKICVKKIRNILSLTVNQKIIRTTFQVIIIFWVNIIFYYT